MEHLNNLFKNLKDRLSSPLIFSFIFSWLVINWKITIGILVYKMPELNKDGYRSYIDMIEQNITLWHTFILPLGASLAYVFLYPLIRNAMSAFQTWTTAWGTNWDLRVSKGSHVPIEKYVELKQHTDREIGVLASIITEQDGAIAENDRQNVKIEELTAEKFELQTELNKWKSVTDSSVLNGEWEYSFSPGNSQKPQISRILISGNSINMHSSSERNWTIINFQRPPDSRQLSMVTEQNQDNNHQISIYRLDVLNNIQTLKGTVKVEDHYYDVSFTKL